MTDSLPPVISLVGRKNSGKTTLLVALAAELLARGLRVASMKHGHHDFEFDQEGRDSWRHFHEGGVEAVIMASGDRIGLVMRTDLADRDPVALLQRLYGGQGYDLVLVEGLKHGPFQKVEVHRSALHPEPLFATGEPTGGALLATVTDRPDRAAATAPVIALREDGSHVHALADLLVRRISPHPEEQQ
jgi:molybdopterin-guanine dinucleotide biosynthesis protein MobB